jgi:transposase
VEHGRSGASESQRSAAARYELAFLGGVGSRGEAEANACPTVGAGAGTSAALSQPACRQQRHSKGEKCRKRGEVLDPAGFEAGQQGQGKKRPWGGDPLGRVLPALGPPAPSQARAGGILLLTALADRFALRATRLAEGASQGPQVRPTRAQLRPQLTPAILTRRAGPKGFMVFPHHWIGERTSAGLHRCRRWAKDCEHRTRSALAFLQRASIRLRSRKRCNPS